MNRKRIELLAPAGNKDAFYAAVNNGADAVYMGGLNFSARAFAENFSHDDFKELVSYAHLRNVKIYVTLNTLLSDFEFDKACEDVKFYYENNVDAILVQDIGLLYWIKINYPDMEVHASTQMHIHNLNGVRNCKELGFNRVVVARESTIDFIKEACKEDIEIETFVHGAICVSYSGQCLLSSAVKSRSANKGMCAQCCRLKYELLDSRNNRIETDTDYLLSPKDMYLLEDIPTLIEAGVSSLKIEGRMKSSAYVGYITSVYRKAIDSYYEKNNYHISNKEIDNMKVLFNRGFTNTYLFDKKEDIFNQCMPNHQGVVIGEVLSWKNRRVQIRLSEELNQFDGVRIYSKSFDDGFIVNKLYVKDKLVSKAFRNEIIELETGHQFKKGDLLLKTVDHSLEDEINKRPLKYLPIDLKVYIHSNERVKVSTDEFVYESDIVAEKAQNAPLTYENIEKQFSKLKETPYCLNSIETDMNQVFLRMSDLNTIRNAFVDAYNNYRLYMFKHKGNRMLCNLTDIQEETDTEQLIRNKDSINEYIINPVINIHSVYNKSADVCVSENGGLLLDTDKLAYYTLNVSNSYSYEFLKRTGFKDIVLSSELNDEQIKELIRKYEERTHKDCKPFVFKDGERTLMYIRNNPFVKYRDASYLKNSDTTLRIVYHDEYTELNEAYSRENVPEGCRILK